MDENPAVLVAIDWKRAAFIFSNSGMSPMVFGFSYSMTRNEKKPKAISAALMTSTTLVCSSSRCVFRKLMIS